MVALFLSCSILMIERLKKGNLHYALARIARRKEILKRKWSGRDDTSGHRCEKGGVFLNFHERRKI